MTSSVKIPQGTLIVVADGRQARLLRNKGDEREISLEQIEAVDASKMPPSTPSGSRPADQRGSENDEAGFAKTLAQELNDGALKHRYDHLVLFADAQTLGQMRPLLHKETQARLIAEHAKDLTKATLGDITRAVS